MVVDERLPRNPAKTKFRYITNKKSVEGRGLSIDEFRLLQNNLNVKTVPVEELQ